MKDNRGQAGEVIWVILVMIATVVFAAWKCGVIKHLVYQYYSSQTKQPATLITEKK